MAQDLPSYLERVRAERPDEFVTVSREMDPGHEVTAAVVKIEKEAKRRPVLLFENVRGSDYPVLTNLHASRSRLAMAMNAPPRGMLKKYLKAMEEPVAPRRGQYRAVQGRGAQGGRHRPLAPAPARTP